MGAFLNSLGKLVNMLGQVVCVKVSTVSTSLLQYSILQNKKSTKMFPDSLHFDSMIKGFIRLCYFAGKTEISIKCRQIVIHGINKLDSPTGVPELCGAIGTILGMLTS